MIKSFRLHTGNLIELSRILASMLTVKEVLEIKVSEWKDTRSLAANRKMWACLGDITRQVEWPVNGQVKLISADDWKDILSASLKREGRIAQGIDGGFVMLGQRTSKMKVQEMCDLIEIIYVFGSNHNVKWSEAIPPEYMEFARLNNE